jgi:cysteine desulfurase family protein (TIGR01976 family)
MIDTASLDMAFVHSQFPGLCDDWALMDNAGGSQIVKGAVERMTEFLYTRNVQVGGSYPRSLAAAEALMQGRQAVQTLMGATRPEEIVFAHSTTVAMQTLAAAMRRQLRPGDEIVVTVADHESNIGPWERLAEFGVVIKVWPLDTASLRLRLEDLAPLMTDRTRLVCVTHASNILGRVNDVAAIAHFVHARGARICVDGVAYAPHRAIDAVAWDVDYYVFSLYKCYGPHGAAMYGKYDLLCELDGLYHYFYGKDKVPAKLEPGNASYELAYSAVGIVNYLAELGRRSGGAGDRRALVVAGFAAITAQENALTQRLLLWLNGRQDCQIIGEGDNSDGGRVPTIAFRVRGVPSGRIAKAVEAAHVAIRFGDFHSRRLVEYLGEDHDEGVVRVSMVHYNTLAQVDRLTAALEGVLAAETTTV